MTASTAVAFGGDPRQLAMGNCYLGELGDRPMSSPTAGGPAAFPPRLTLAAQVAHGQRRRTQWRRSQVPRNSSGDKTGTNRRTADARFSTTGGISPDSPQSRSASLRDRTLFLAHHAGDPAHGAKPTDRRGIQIDALLVGSLGIGHAGGPRMELHGGVCTAQITVANSVTHSSPAFCQEAE